MIFREYKKESERLHGFYSPDVVESHDLNENSSKHQYQRDIRTPQNRENGHFEASNLGKLITNSLKEKLLEGLPKESEKSLLSGEHQSFYSKVQHARGRIKNKDALSQDNHQAIDVTAFLNSIPVKPFSLYVGLLFSKRDHTNKWLKNIIFELSTFTGTYIPATVYKNIPKLKKSLKSLRYKNGIFTLIEKSERKCGHMLLTSDEKAKMATSTKNFIIYTQLAYNRLYFIAKHSKTI